MAKIENIKGWFVSVNTGNHTLDIQLDSNVIPVLGPPYGASNLHDVKTYRYREALEWEDKEFYNYSGKRVQCRLIDDIVDKITPLS